ncbi:hypothetical protein Pmani_012171 [Petrolisthes manimaculis]|uniref:Uncharacterized protein n=1 Tax=Petrolisthes manimaculis TaxID=1843537 RepID=A0AAE1Q1D4_9EUCA|nr:hypothetical protein Pmani_012171 [Petrolisthes manimaculis]
MGFLEHNQSAGRSCRVISHLQEARQPAADPLAPPPALAQMDFAPGATSSPRSDGFCCQSPSMYLHTGIQA